MWEETNPHRKTGRNIREDLCLFSHSSRMEGRSVSVSLVPLRIRGLYPQIRPTTRRHWIPLPVLVLPPDLLLHPSSPSVLHWSPAPLVGLPHLTVPVSSFQDSWGRDHEGATIDEGPRDLFDFQFKIGRPDLSFETLHSQHFLCWRSITVFQTQWESNRSK